MSLTCLRRPVRRAAESLHHRAAARTALLPLALGLAPSVALACPQCAGAAGEAPRALLLLALAPIALMSVAVVWLVRESRRPAELE